MRHAAIFLTHYSTDTYTMITIIVCLSVISTVAILTMFIVSVNLSLMLHLIMFIILNCVSVMCCLGSSEYCAVWTEFVIDGIGIVTVLGYGLVVLICLILNA